MIGQKGVPAHSGGIERHVDELSKRLAKQGHDVRAYCRSWYGESKDNHEGVHCIETPSIKTKHLDAITHTFTSILHAVKDKVDIIHIHGVGPALLAWLPKLLSPSTKVVVTFHCVDRFHQKWNAFARLMLHIGEWMACKMPDMTITVSKTLQNYCLTKYKTHTIYIPNGTSLPDDKADARELDCFNLDPYRYLMMCSRLVRHKRAHTLIEAWKQLSNENPKLIGAKKLAIVGGSAFTDDYVEELEELAKGDDSVVLTGTQTGETLKSLFTHSYAVVHPSASEGLPVAIIEAMGYGKCVLSSNIPENEELTEENGLTFELDNIEDLKQKMTMILEHPDLAEAVGREARHHVTKNYDWADISQKTGYLYEMTCLVPTLEQRIV